MEATESSGPEELVVADRRARSIIVPPPGQIVVPALSPRSNRLVHGLYALPDGRTAPLGGPVSPFRLPREVEIALWEPPPFPAILPGTATPRATRGTRRYSLG
jgi:hypothetical protein